MMKTDVSTPRTPWEARNGGAKVQAYYLGRRLDTGRRRPASHAVVQRVGDGLAILFPYGAVVIVDLEQDALERFVTSLASRVEEAFESPADDELHVSLRKEPSVEGLDEEGELGLSALSEERLLVVADILAKSVVLDHFEQTIGRVFDEMQPLADQMRGTGRTGRRSRDLVRRIGQALAVRQEMVWRVEVEDKPDILWDQPELGRLWGRLSDEYELPERHRVLERKVDLIAQTASTLLEILQNDRTLRVEWYIVLLICFEIGLTLFEMAHAASP